FGFRERGRVQTGGESDPEPPIQFPRGYRSEDGNAHDVRRSIPKLCWRSGGGAQEIACLLFARCKIRRHRNWPAHYCRFVGWRSPDENCKPKAHGNAEASRYEKEQHEWCRRAFY